MILVAKKIRKAFTFPKKVQILSDISLSVERGESIAICGKSGEGKTTLLQILGTLETPDEGSLTIHNTLVTPSLAAQLRSRHIGFVFQSYNLLEDFTALENVLMPARIARKPCDQNQGLALLSLVGLQDRAHFPVKLLSGGERQRIAIARALCNDPDLILADEPSGNLDHVNAHIIGSLLLSLVKEKKKSLILVTHDPELASLCDRQFVLSEGNLEEIKDHIDLADAKKVLADTKKNGTISWELIKRKFSL